MFGEIFSLKNILILIGVILTMSIVMNSFGNTTGSKGSDTFSNVEKFSTSDVKEMFKDVKEIKNDLGFLIKELNKLKKISEKINPTIASLNKKSHFKKKKSKKNEVHDDDVVDDVNEEENNKERRTIRKKKKERFEEKFTGYNSQYGQDYLLLDD